MKTEKWQITMLYTLEMKSKNKWGPSDSQIRKRIKTDLKNNRINEKDFVYYEGDEIE